MSWNITKLSDRQRKFCELYVKTGNATQSYMDSYPQKDRVCACSSANQLLNQTKIKEYIEILTTRELNDRIADLDECLEILTTFMRDKNASKAERTKAIDLRLKTLGAYIDKKQIDVNDSIDIKVSLVEEDED